MRKLAALIVMALAGACAPPEKDPPDAGSGGSGGTGGSGGSGGGSGGVGGSGGATGVSYNRDVKPIFVSGGCVECHHATSAVGYDFNNPFDPAKGIINRDNSYAANGSMYPKVVEPGNPSRSSLIAKVERTDLDLHTDGAPMPMEVPYLTAAQVQAVRDWITGGATMDGYAASVAPIFGTQITLGGASGSGKCTFCHYAGASNGLNILEPFSATSGLVNRASTRYGGKLVTPGDPDSSVLMKKLTGQTAGAQMPMRYFRLSGAQVKTLKDWIAAGAQNN
jgi:hypothetical protein